MWLSLVLRGKTTLLGATRRTVAGRLSYDLIVEEVYCLMEAKLIGSLNIVSIASATVHTTNYWRPITRLFLLLHHRPVIRPQNTGASETDNIILRSTC